MIESRNGREGASFKFVGNNQKRDIYKYENKKIEIDLYYHNIKSNLALSPELYDLGEFGIAKISMENFWERDMFNEFSIGSQLHFSSSFAKLNFRTGYYKKDKFGIRIENLIYVKKNKNKLYFENLTLAPIDKDLINFNLLTEDEKSYLWKYNLDIYTKLYKYLNSNEKRWLATFIQ